MMWIWILIAFALIAMFLMMANRPAEPRGTTAGGTRRDTALDILQERYARGEIDREEFEQKKRDLTI